MDFRKLKIFQKSHELTLDIYNETNKFPETEKFGIVSQLRRAAYSVPSNIAEGYGRATKKEFTNFLVIARASVEEVRYFLLLAKDLKYINEKDYCNLDKEYTNLKYSIHAFINTLSNKNGK
ncbi:MAG: four helix bundle protein [Patescibacteria group bacterium]|jgi:four helix bundle protein